jgi:hypothetical protein
VVHQDQSTAGSEDTSHLAYGEKVIENAAEGVGAYHRVERVVWERQVLGVGFEQLQGPTQLLGSGSCYGEHVGTEVDADQGQIVRIVGHVETGPDGDF